MIRKLVEFGLLMRKSVDRRVRILLYKILNDENWF